MIDVIDILQDGKRRTFSRNACKDPLWLPGVIAYHQELVIELGEEGFDSFSEFLVSPRWGTPILLVEPVRNLQRDISYIKQVLLYLGTNPTFTLLRA